MKKKKKVINVLECGADPSGAADCTAAFKEALADSSAAGILVPAGTYKLSGLIKGDPSLLIAPPPDKAEPSATPGDGEATST